ncbi:MAG: hypothetical protein LBB83_01010, partial [Treponema sp.]|nr:hypothetical protein [Treponema sp.]
APTVRNNKITKFKAYFVKKAFCAVAESAEDAESSRFKAFLVPLFLVNGGARRFFSAPGRR